MVKTPNVKMKTDWRTARIENSECIALIYTKLIIIYFYTLHDTERHHPSAFV